MNLLHSMHLLQVNGIVAGVSCFLFLLGLNLCKMRLHKFTYYCVKI